MKLLYVIDLMYRPGDKIGEDVTSVQIFHSLQILSSSAATLYCMLSADIAFMLFATM